MSSVHEEFNHQVIVDVSFESSPTALTVGATPAAVTAAECYQTVIPLAFQKRHQDFYFDPRITRHSSQTIRPPLLELLN